MRRKKSARHRRRGLRCRQAGRCPSGSSACWVQRLEVAVDEHEVATDLVTAAVERRRQGAQGGRELGRLDRAQQRVEVVEDGLELDGHPAAVLRDDVAGPDRSRRLGRRDQVDVALAEERLGQQASGDVRRDLRDLVGLERQLEPRPRRRGLDVAHLADEQAAQLDVRALLQLAAQAVRIERDHDDGREALLERRDGETEKQRQHEEEDDSVCLLPQTFPRVLGDRARCRVGADVRGGIGRRDGHPAILTLVVAPQMARERKKSTMLMATIEVRTAVPTATPTPAGPPEAV